MSKPFIARGHQSLIRDITIHCLDCGHTSSSMLGIDVAPPNICVNCGSMGTFSRITGQRYKKALVA